MALVTFTDKRKDFDARIKQIGLLEDSYVLVGFQDGKVTKSQVKGTRRKEAGISMAQIAAENEFGTKTTPARPFLTTSFDENLQKINQLVANEYGKVLNGESTTRQSLNALGQFVTRIIQQKIRAIHTPPNSANTIAVKGSSKPLIDFGQMVQSVRHKVVLA